MATDSAADFSRVPVIDIAAPHEFRGTYGDYLLGKVSKVFPQLGRDGF